MTDMEKMAVRSYLRGLTFGDKEFYEEMYDHICTAYEHREDDSRTVRAFIQRVVEPDFGGRSGLRNVYRLQSQSRKRLIYRRALSLFRAYFFRWPTILITASLFLLILLLNQRFDPIKVFEISTMVGLMVPFFVSHYGKWRFKKECLRLRAPYKKSKANDTIHNISIAGVALLYGAFSLINRWVFGHGDGFFEFFSQFPVSFVPVSMFLLVYALVCLQLFKEKFNLKLQ